MTNLRPPTADLDLESPFEAVPGPARRGHSAGFGDLTGRQNIVEIEAAARSSTLVGSTPRYRIASVEKARADTASGPTTGRSMPGAGSAMYIITTTRR